MTEEEIKRVVKEAVHDTLSVLGLNMENLAEVQKDIRHLNKSRQICDWIQAASIVTAIGVFGTGFVWLVKMALNIN